jgi:hypothetical protein
MSKNNCCCTGIPPGLTFNSFCCNPILFTDFITLYGDSMADHAEVSPEDWIALKQTRDGVEPTTYGCVMAPLVNNDCACCCNECSDFTDNFTSSNNSINLSQNANDSFDRFNVNGKVIKQDKLKPKLQTNLFNNNFLKVNKFNKKRLFLDTTSNNSNSFDLFSTTYNYNQQIKSGDSVFFSGEAEGNYNFSFVYGDEVSEFDAINFNSEFEVYVADLNRFVGECGACNVAACNCFPEGCGAGGAAADARCNQACCCGHKEVISSPDFTPMYFAYKYSGCHFIWFPREFLFDKDPFITQCTNTLTYADNQCGSEGLKQAVSSCGAFSDTRFMQGWLTPRSWECSDGFALTAGARGIFPDAFPCHCANFPHIHGGLKDSAFGEFNVSQRPNQLGYIPSFRAFMPAMERDEAGCCWCSGANLHDSQIFLDITAKENCRIRYPFSPGYGKTIRFYDLCGPGLSCHYFPVQEDNWAVGNPNYKQSCFEWGISPYLLRVAKDKFKAGYEIFRHGESGTSKYFFGGEFLPRSIEVDTLRRDYIIKIRKTALSKTTLKDQCIGFVQLEHHFECCAFRCPSGILTKDPGVIINTCTNTYPLYESDGYPGKFIGTGGGAGVCVGERGVRAKFKVSSYGANLWQIKRGVPRRVMYAGSGIPIFKFDLINMENWSRENTTSGNYFDAETFLEHWYRYYFGLISWAGDARCKQGGVGVEPIEWDYTHFLNSYDYVSYWLERMVEVGILRIKDHAIDIANEVNEIIGSAAYIQDPDDPESEILSIDAKAARECGGITGYLDLVNFFGVEPGQKTVTPKQVKQLLLNEEGLTVYTGPGTEPNSNSSKMRAFLPRRARLPIGPIDTTIVPWGCTASIEIENLSTIPCPSYIDDSVSVPEIFNRTTEEDFGDISPIKVVCGLAATFLVDRTGKIIPWGGAPSNGDVGTCGELSLPNFENEIEQVPCEFTMHPTKVASVPWYINLLAALDTTTNSLKPFSQIADGSVKDLVFQPNYCVALIDLDKRSVSAYCDDFELGYRPSWEWGEWTPSYQASNTNGSNVSLTYVPGTANGVEQKCIINEPWNIVFGSLNTSPPDNSGSPSPDDEPIFNVEYPGVRNSYSNGPAIDTFRLKSWGSAGKTCGTFSLSKEDAIMMNMGGLGFIQNNDPTCNNQVLYSDLCECIENFDPSNDATLSNMFIKGFRGYDPEINPNNLRYPGTNTWFIWTNIAGGLKHFAALDDFGGIFVTALSSNEDGQSNKGKPLPYFDINKTESWPQQGFSDPRLYYPDYCGFESRFNYYNHIPRPGFVSEEDWTQDFYNSVTSRYSPWLNCNGACSVTVTTDPSVQNNCFRIVQSDRSGINITCKDQDAIGGGQQTPACYERIKLPPDCEINYDSVRRWDLTTYLMGSFCQRPFDNSSGYNDETINGCKHTPRISQQPRNDFQPRYVNLTAGLFNTMLLTNENRVELYGTYYQIDEDGQKIGPLLNVINPDGSITQIIQGITCFVPDVVKNLQGNWNIEYGCPAYCPGITYELDDGRIYEATRGITHNPIITATYSYPSQENTIDIIKSSGDYSIATTKGSKIFVWGDASMVPGGFIKETYYPGLTSAQEIDLVTLDNLPPGITRNDITIKEVAVGIHTFYIHYKINIANSGADFYRTYSYTRYGATNTGEELPQNLKNAELISISAGNRFAMAIANSGEGPKTWNYNAFAPEHKKYQYKGFSGLPLYLRRDAFFHAIPGNWDFSKWLWGGNCCSKISTQNPDHPCLREDKCSALAYNLYRDVDGQPIESDVPDDSPRRYNIEKSYSGHPEYIWHRPDIRRTTYQAMTQIQDTQELDLNTGLSINNCSVLGDQLFPIVSFNNTQTIDFGFCLEGLGSVWGSAVPQSPLYNIKRKRSLSLCVGPSECNPEASVVRGICPDGDYVCSAFSVPITTSFAATKDVFQFKTGEWSISNPYSANLNGCIQFRQYRLNYFKYSQRSFYLGYDSEKDTWEIYRSPDIFRDTVVNSGTYTDLCCEGLGCPNPNQNLWDCPGFTGINTNGNCGWGGGVTGVWPGLSDYPMVGPNYTRLDINAIPLHIPKDGDIGKALFYHSLPPGNSNRCDSINCYGSQTNSAAFYTKVGGPAVLAFKPVYISCATSDPETQEVEPPSIPSGSSVYFHQPVFETTDPPRIMLWGTENNISNTIPPANDPNYKSVGFRNVLLDPSKTIIDLPWIEGDEIERFVIFQSGFPGKILLNNHGLTSGSVILFDVPNSETFFGNIKRVRILTPGSSDIEYLQEQTAYFISPEQFTENSFTIARSLNTLNAPLNLEVVDPPGTYGVTSSSSIGGDKWYHMFDLTQSYFENVFASGNGYRRTNCFDNGITACYEGQNPVIPMGGEFVVIKLTEDGDNVENIIGSAILCPELCCDNT